MPCCGSKRTQEQQNSNPLAENREPLYFQYIGKTGMTVIGRESRLRYRFEHTGAVIAVDARDLAALMAVPNLRQVNSAPMI
jgi:hypothetical protein